jgi:hypothetical protein
MKNRSLTKFAKSRQNQSFLAIPLSVASSTLTGEALHAMAA